MSQLARPAVGVEPKDVLIRLRMGKKIHSHAGSNPSELAARVATEGTYIDSSHEVEFADAIQGPPGPPAVYVGPTPPDDHTMFWGDTS